MPSDRQGSIASGSPTSSDDPSKRAFRKERARKPIQRKHPTTPTGAPRPPGYFEKKGEVYELRQLLRGAATEKDDQKKRDAIKKVIAYMTLGIDVSPLFSEMVMASATQDLVQKKMVYLYLVNYSESNAELAILAVNTLLKDCQDDDPMIRGLALRSLCSLSLADMVEYLQPAVLRALEDVNGYVRKTAVIGALKLWKIQPSAVEESELLPMLQKLVSDADAHVVSNAIAAVEEVMAAEGGFQPDRELVYSMLNRLNQFSEWGQCSVLRLLSKYQVVDEGEMFDIMNILDGLLKQSSSAVVLSVTKMFIDLTSNRPELQVDVIQRLKGPLLTLMASPTPELSYTVLMHILALLRHGSASVHVFSSEYKQFFCRFNDPSYIKGVKIDILTLLVDLSNAAGIVGELSEYVTDVDADISRRAIRAIGKVALHTPDLAGMIVESLTTFLQLDIDFVSTEAAVTMKDLLRKYPEQLELLSGAVERCIKLVTEPDGKCAILWILGESGLLMVDAPYLLEEMIDNFSEEPSGAVRLEMLAAAAKLFFSRPPEMQAMLGRLLDKAMTETTHPDVRDRALLYYRLLSHSPEEARRVICPTKETIEEFCEELNAEMTARIFDEFNTLSTIYQSLSSKFVVEQAAQAIMSKMIPPPAPDDPNSGGVSGYHFGTGGDDVAVELSDMLGGHVTPAMQPTSADFDLLMESTAGEASDLLGTYDPLDGASPAVSPAPPTFAATPLVLQPGAVLDGATFERRWAQLEPRQWQRPMLPGTQPTTESVEQSLRVAGISVIASGSTPQGLKFFCYAKQKIGTALGPGEVWFLCELLLCTNMATCTVKPDNAPAASAAAFCEQLWLALSAVVS